MPTDETTGMVKAQGCPPLGSLSLSPLRQKRKEVHVLGAAKMEARVVGRHFLQETSQSQKDWCQAGLARSPMAHLGSTELPWLPWGLGFGNGGGARGCEWLRLVQVRAVVVAVLFARVL